jgi:insertion element IS1 protein InsB
MALGAYLRLLDEQRHTVGKTNTQKIEPKHLTYVPALRDLLVKQSVFPSLNGYMIL